jgi:hypothetical protein
LNIRPLACKAGALPLEPCSLALYALVIFQVVF